MPMVRRLRTCLVLAASVLGTIGLGAAQDAPEPKAGGGAIEGDRAPARPAKKPGRRARKGGLGVRAGAPPRKGQRPNAADPLTKQAGAAAAALPGVAPTWPFHFRLQYAGAGGTLLSATYYPPKTHASAPVLMLVHETGRGRSGKDFEDPIDELQGQGFAEYLQNQGYAVLVPDLRGHGANPRRELTAHDWRSMVEDLQNAYHFLVDRHNRGDLNLGKFGVVALGDGADLVAAWAATPGSAVTGEGRISDLGALVLIAPLGDIEPAGTVPGFRLGPSLATLAPRVPIYLAVGERDRGSIAPVRGVQAVVERQRRSKVAYYDTPLHGYKLLQFFPKVPTAIVKFLDDPVKFRIGDWEPRYLMTPVSYGHIELVAPAAPARRVVAPEPEPKAQPAPEPEPEKKAAPARKKGRR